MKCKVCGANNEDFLEYCENCAAPLTESAAQADDTGGAAREQRSWGFVSSPDWSKPDFSANTVSEKDIPEGFEPNAIRPRYNAVQQSVADTSGAKRNSVRANVRAAAPGPAIPCPHCGSSVQANQRFCNHCGHAMDEPAAEPIRTAAPAQDAPTVAFSDASAATAIKYADPIDDDMFSFNYDEDEDRPRKKKNGTKAPATKPVSARSRSGSGRSRKRGGLAVDKSIIFWILAAVLIVALVVMGIVLVNKSGGFANLFGGIFSSSAVTKEPTVEKTTTENGDPAYNITVYAKRNSIVRFEGGSIKHDTPVSSSKPIVLSVPEAVWVPSEPVEGDKLEIYPNITVIAKDGTETPLTFAEPIVIDIPTLNLSVTAPNTPSFDTASPDVTITGVVDDPTSAVYVNDMQLTVDESGNFEGVYTLSAEGANTINVEARKNGYAIARQAFTVNYGTGTPATTTPGATTPGATTPGVTTPGTTTTGGGSTAAPGTMPTGATAVGYATTADLKVRSQANSTSDDTVIGKLGLNEKIYIIEKDAGNSWAKVLYNGSEAYVSNLYVNIVDGYTVKDATVTTDNLNGRSSASSSSESLAKFPLNATVSYIKDVGNDWSMIEYDGKILYAATNYLKVS